jgi:hypothetical protein
LKGALGDEFSALSGQNSDFILDNRFISVYPVELKRDIESFKSRLQTVSPISEDGRYYFGKGCKQHKCMTDEAVWVVDKKTGHLTACTVHVNLGKKGRKINVDIELYGNPVGKNNLPPPLEKWKTDLVDNLNSFAQDDNGIMIDAIRAVEEAHDAESHQK